MINASKVLYIIAIVLCAMTVLTSILAVVNWDIYKETFEKAIDEILMRGYVGSPGLVKESMDLFMKTIYVTLIASAVINAISGGVALYGFLTLNVGKTDSVPHILAIVFGALGGGILILIGGILALVGNSKIKNGQAAQQTQAGGTI